MTVSVVVVVVTGVVVVLEMMVEVIVVVVGAGCCRTVEVMVMVDVEDTNLVDVAVDAVTVFVVFPFLMTTTVL